jgi:microcin C transport system ATP-binding protein
MADVGLPDPEKRITALPHELSGGQRQRVMIAMALANTPDVLIADEPTTALDVTVQQHILDLLQTLQRKMGMAILFISHDLTIVRRIAHHVYVMQHGQVVEHGSTTDVFTAPQHPYTQTLLAAAPKGTPVPLPKKQTPLLKLHDLKVWYPIRKGLLKRTVGHVKALNPISLDLYRGETLGIVGESGSGKTTMALALLRLIRSEGAVVFMGQNTNTLSNKALQPLRQKMQIVFQDPFGALSPRMTVGEIISEGLRVHAPGLSSADRTAACAMALQDVGLQADVASRYPHEFSGGQRQRIAIARAMILKPEFVVLDEPTSALDLTIQAQIIDLLKDLQRKYQLTYMFISHDLRVVKSLAHRLVVLQHGDVVEHGDADTLFAAPQHPYTQALLAAAFAS